MFFMEHVVVGLGNPGIEYQETRHNVGRMVVMFLAERWGTSDWRDDKKLHAKISQGAVLKKHAVKLVLPDNYMNRSGGSVAPLIKNKKQAERLVVVHDDIDLGMGTLKVVFNRGSGGHRGVDSIQRSLKTKEYVRVRVGVIPVSPTGKLRKPKGENKVYDFILKRLTKREADEIEKVVRRAAEAVEAVILQGRAKASCEYNGTISQRKKVTKKIKSS